MNLYKLSALADADLNNIRDYVARDSVRSADRLVDAFFAAFAMLAESPQLGHARPDLTSVNFLFWRVRSYLIVYRILEADTVQIAAVLHGARDIPGLLDERGLS